MSRYKYWHLPTLLALASVSGLTLGNEHGHREMEAHQHGHGSINVVADGDELVIELEIPGVNVVGFEHEPSTDTQKARVTQAIAVFRNAKVLFAPTPGAKCELEDVDVSLGATEHHEKTHDEGHREHDKREDEEHATSSEGHGEEHDEEQDGETHSELHALYAFHCANSDELEGIDVRVFEHLREAEELDAQVITSSVQGAVELTPENTWIELAK